MKIAERDTDSEELGAEKLGRNCLDQVGVLDYKSAIILISFNQPSVEATGKII